MSTKFRDNLLIFIFQLILHYVSVYIRYTLCIILGEFIFAV